MATLPDPNPHSTVLPINQVSWKNVLYEESKKKAESLAIQTTPNQNSKLIRNQGMTNSINSHINNRMSDIDKSGTNSTDSHTDSKAGENDGTETVVPEDIGE